MLLEGLFKARSLLLKSTISSSSVLAALQRQFASVSSNTPVSLFGPTISRPIYNLDLETVGRTELPADIFGIEVRKDILHRVVRWQRAKKQQGTHVTKGRSEVRGGGRKPHKQKGTGRARLGSIRVPQARGGGIVHGPVLRSHAHKLPKKVRRLGLKCALSAKAIEDRLLIVNDFDLPDAKTQVLEEKLMRVFKETQQRPSVLLVDRKDRQDIRRAASNLHWVNVLPPEHINVYSILQQGHLIVSQDALTDMISKLHTPIMRGPIDRARWKVEQGKRVAVEKLPETAERLVNAPHSEAESPAVAV